MEYIILIILGICTFIIGIFTYKGNIAFIHWYNKWKVSKQNSKEYAKAMGLGTMIIGLSIF